MSFLNRQSGYSLLELMVAVGISTVLVAVGAGLVTQSFRGQNLVFSSFTPTEFRLQVESLRMELTNTLKLEPPMDLFVPGDQKFIGFSDINPSQAPVGSAVVGASQCRLLSSDETESSSIFFSASIDRSRSFAKVLRFWEESSLSVPKEDPKFLYRNIIVNFSEDPQFPFQESASNPPSYLLLIDADGVRTRLYRVVRIKSFSNSPINYSSLKEDGGNYPHTEIEVELIKTLAGNPGVPSSQLGFITDSLVYAVQLNMFCLDAQTGGLVSFDPFRPEKRKLLLQKEDSGFILNRFLVEFSGTRRDRPANLNLFYQNFYGAPTLSGALKDPISSDQYTFEQSRECANVIRFRIFAKSKKQDVSSFKVESSIYLHNFDVGRPSRCNGLD